MFRLMVGLVLAGALGLAGSGWGYELPEVIAVIEGPADHRYFGFDFDCVGDYNHDGYDDLIAATAVDRDRETWLNIYPGGERMSSEPVFQFTNIDSFHHNWILPLRQFFPNRNPFVAVGYTTYRALDSKIIFYEFRDSLDQTPEFRFDSDHWRYFYSIAGSSAGDLNGDGNLDYISTRRLDDSTLTVCYFWGGADFDTIPDLTFNIHDYWDSAVIPCTKDVNGDGYDDFVIRLNIRSRRDRWFGIFLGGSPPDTVPHLEFYNSMFQGRYSVVRMSESFTLLQDVNHDGYDDLGICWYEMYEAYEADGAYIFFGGEEMDAEPDLNLRGISNVESDYRCICGGDFNGDGFGDIALSYANAIYEYAEVHYHLGGYCISEEPDILINFNEDYGGLYRNKCGTSIGGVGDYNGDGADDLVIGPMGPMPRVVVLLAGSTEWEVSAPSESTIPNPTVLNVNVSPNPFNSEVEIRIDYSEAVEVSIYDIKGRILFRNQLTRGPGKTRTLSWHSSSAGIFFVVAEAVVERKVVKVVCLP